MLDPIVMPVPLAAAALAALTYAAVIVRSWLTPALPVAPAKPRTTSGRHRLGVATTPYRPRDWRALNADLVAARTAAHPSVGCDWHEDGGYGYVRDCPACKQAPAVKTAPAADWRQPLTEFERRVGAMQADTREMAAVR